jgi:hypothetical protein
MSNDFNPNSVDAKLSELLTKTDHQTTLLVEVKERLNDHSKRLAYLERFRFWLMGAAAAVAGLFGEIKQYLGNHK